MRGAAEPISFKDPKGLFAVSAQINGAGPFRLIVDSSAGPSVLDTEVVDQLKLEVGDALTAAGMGRAAPTRWRRGAVVQ